MSFTTFQLTKIANFGFLLRKIMEKSTAHIVAMTGSYFRGDSVPVLLPEDEAKFTKVTYNYYEQLNGYTHLKSLGIGYHFYQKKYLGAIDQVLNTNKKTILHIPSVQSGESTQDKYNGSMPLSIRLGISTTRTKRPALFSLSGTVTDHQDCRFGQ